MNEQRDLVAIDSNTDLAPRMVMTTQQALARLADFQGFVNQVMVKGVDYGSIPGVDKPTLLKPGAEKLCEIYAFTPEVEVINRVEDWDAGFFHYECTCRLINRRTGLVQAVGVGSCNSREKRYSDRWVFESEIPDGVDKGTLKRREGISRKNGRPYTQYLWKNEDIYTLVNTILKMAKKRALIDATLSATRSSGMFTQDVEDWVDTEARHPEPTPAARPPQQPKATPASAAPVAQPEAPKTNAAPPEPWPDIPADLRNAGDLMTWANNNFKVTSSAVCMALGIKDTSQLGDLQKAAEMVRSHYGMKPTEAAPGVFEEVQA